MPTEDAKRALSDLWEQVLSRWDEAALHDAALDLARHSELLPDLAARYRKVKDDEAAPEAQRELAKKRLGAIALVAMQALDGARTAPKPGLPRWVTVVVAIVSALVSIWAVKQVMGP